MAVNIWQSIDSPRLSAGDSSSIDFTYHANGDDDEAAVLAAVLAATSTTYAPLGLTRSNVEIEPQRFDDLWKVVVRYTVRPDGDAPIFSFETSGGTVQIQHSLETLASYGTSPPNFQNAIGVNGDRIDGCEKIVPVFNFGLTANIPVSAFNAAYIAAIYGVTGKVNNAEFQNFAAGEVLFLGANGTKRGTDGWQIDFKFAASPNVTGLQIGGITGIAKPGWAYLWIRFQDDESSSTLIKRPQHVYVERVYENADFSVLGLS